MPASQASGAKPSPVGIRTLSSSTLNSPSAPRTTSSPAKPTQPAPRRPACRLVERALVDEAVRHDAGLDDPPLAVGVAQEGVECADALGEAAVERLPLLAREHARHGVDHELVGPGRAVADLPLERPRAQAPAELREVGRAERLHRGAVLRTRRPVLVDLVVVHAGERTQKRVSSLLSGFARTLPDMSLFRTLPTSRLLALSPPPFAAAGRDRPRRAAARRPPPAKPLARPSTTRRGARGPGVTARIRFTNNLIDSSSLEGGGPLLTGATGRLWLGDGSSGSSCSPRTATPRSSRTAANCWVYDAELATPSTAARCRRTIRPPTGRRQAADVRRSRGSRAGSTELAQHGRPSRARPRPTSPGSRPTRCASRPSTTAACSAPASSPGTPPRGVPLRRRLRQGRQPPGARAGGRPTSPTAGAGLDFDDLAARRRQGRRTSTPPSGRGPAGADGRDSRVTGVGAVCEAVPFKLVGARHARRAAAPARSGWSTARRDAGALVTYGQGLGGDRRDRAAGRRRASQGRAAARRRGALSCRASRSAARPATSSTTALGDVSLRARRRRLHGARLGARPTAAEAAARGL